MERRRSNVSTNRNAAFLAVIGIALLAAALTTGCAENPVGRKCFIGSDGGVGESTAIVASPALECPSRTCLRVPRAPGLQLPEGSEYTNLCTASCETDEDCDRVPESPCQTGFTCAIPVVVGPFCCRKLCICKDYLIIPDGGVPIPAACDQTNADNMCCNLPGRDTLPECQ